MLSLHVANDRLYCGAPTHLGQTGAATERTWTLTPALALVAGVGTEILQRSSYALPKRGTLCIVVATIAFVNLDASTLGDDTAQSVAVKGVAVQCSGVQHRSRAIGRTRNASPAGLAVQVRFKDPPANFGRAKRAGT